MKNKVASILKLMGIGLFVLSVIGAIIISQKEEMVATGSKYVPYTTQTNFDFGLFLMIVIASGIGCMLLYAFGELLELTAKNHALLEKACHVEAQQEHVPATNEIEKSKEIAGANQQQAEQDGFEVAYGLSFMMRKMYEWIESKELKPLGLTLVSSNDGTHTFTFQAQGEQGSARLKIKLYQHGDGTYFSFNYQEAQIANVVTRFKDFVNQQSFT